MAGGNVGIGLAPGVDGVEEIQLMVFDRRGTLLWFRIFNPLVVVVVDLLVLPLLLSPRDRKRSFLFVIKSSMAVELSALELVAFVGDFLRFLFLIFLKGIFGLEESLSGRTMSWALTISLRDSGSGSFSLSFSSKDCTVLGQL